MASSHVTVGSGDHHVPALHGWFGSARGKAIHQVLLQAPDRVREQSWATPVALATSIEEFLAAQ